MSPALAQLCVPIASSRRHYNAGCAPGCRARCSRNERWTSEGTRVPTIRRRALIAAGLAAPIARPRVGGAAATTPTPKPDPLPVGALFPFSGSLSLLGDESFRGLDMAIDEVNATGGLLGRPVLAVRGDASDAGQASTEAKRLIEQVKVAMVFGALASPVSFAASAVTEVAAIPYVELDALADPITERGFKLLFRTGPLASACGTMAVDAVADLLAPLWRTEPAALKLAILFEDGLAGAAVAAAQEARCKALALQVVDKSAYAASTLDFAPQAQRLRGAGTDVVLHTGLANDVVSFHRALQQAGWQPRMVVGAGGGYALGDTAQALGPAFEGVLSVGMTPYAVSDLVAPGAAEVAAAYQRKYGAPPRSGHSLVCFAGARAAFAAIRRAGTFDRDALRPALLATDIPDNATVCGYGVKFDDHGQNTRAVPMVGQWQNGTLLAVAPRLASVAAARAAMGG